MNVVTHFLIGWNAGLRLGRTARATALIAAVSVIPDIDGLGAVVDVIRGGEAEMFLEYHHKFGHCALFGLLMLPLIYLLGKRSLKLALSGFLIFHLHLLCDIVGARGPDGYQWPLYYFWPFSDVGITWSGQWQINAWPNILLTCLLIVDFLRQSAKKGFTPFCFVSRGAESVLVETLQRRLGGPDEQK
jgi:hypothetical protein